ncbi:ATP synthase subunit O, mitochondrial-like [Vicia villosa]|uniref:ATP synthase subunit O, mitochondrial-like n=1 Tax=Vicia villosa TaxID=3911 RepID=UPI00273C0A14|nr:ATP synthase subunit O, mitochondrial-like [Vicia villosa]XP_058758993.1 ATP synthase subunit O, mitochondrial-like [Vicia villosa]
MAFYGRVKSGISLCNKLGLLSSQRSTLQRSLIAPSISQASRNFADVPGQKETKIKVPIAMFGGSGNYASALYIAAVKVNAVEKVDSELIQFVEGVKGSPITSQFIKDISVAKDVRVKVIQDIASQAKFSDVTKNFLVLLAENGRLKNVDTIAKRFAELAMAYKGEVKATVTTVIALPPEEENALKQTVQEMLGSGAKVKLEQKIDPSILGGLVLEFSQKVFDMSIKTRAQQMERILREPANYSI